MPTMLLRLRIRFRQILRDLEKQVKKLCDALEDTLIFITLILLQRTI